MAKTKTRTSVKKQRSITAKLMRGIVMILFLTVFIPFFAYYNLPEWVYFLAPGTRLWLAIDDINGTYGTDEFDETVRLAEKRLDSNIEIYTADDLDRVSGYARNAVNWAVPNGILTVDAARNVRPADPATRGEIAHAIHAFLIAAGE